MSLLQYLDPTYFARVSCPPNVYRTFQNSFPEKGPPLANYQQAKELMEDLHQYYSPIYDKQTWKKETEENGLVVSVGCVEERWWDVLSMMLQRPAEVNCKPLLLRLNAADGLR